LIKKLRIKIKIQNNEGQILSIFELNGKIKKTENSQKKSKTKIKIKRKRTKFEKNKKS
jgi:hypothetical protein